MSWCSPAAPCMPWSPFTSSPSSTPPPAATSSAPIPCHIGMWQGACRSGPSGGSACRIGHTVGGGYFPLPEWPRCWGHTGAGIAPALPSSSPLVPISDTHFVLYNFLMSYLLLSICSHKFSAFPYSSGTSFLNFLVLDHMWYSYPLILIQNTYLAFYC